MTKNELIAFIEEQDAAYNGLVEYMKSISHSVPRFIGLQINPQSPNWFALRDLAMCPDTAIFEQSENGRYAVFVYDDSGFDVTSDQVERMLISDNILNIQPAPVAKRFYSRVVSNDG